VLQPRGVHQGPHPLNGLRQAHEDRLADQEVADVQLGDLRDGGDRLDGGVVDAVAGVDLQAQARGQGRALLSGA
jgi:hypothetical protein